MTKYKAEVYKLGQIIKEVYFEHDDSTSGSMSFVGFGEELDYDSVAIYPTDDDDLKRTVTFTKKGLKIS